MNNSLIAARGNSYAVDIMGRITNSGFVYDSNGRLTTRPGTDGTTHLSYDYAGRVTSLTLANGFTIVYGLDGDGRMRSETRAGKRFDMVFDGKDLLRESNITVSITSTSGTPPAVTPLRPRDLVRLATGSDSGVVVTVTKDITDYTYGLGLLSQRTTVSRFYRWDGIGSLRNLEDSSKNIVASSVFDAYGLQRNAVTLASAYGFVGEEGVRGEKGLAAGTLVPQNMRARMYDPLTGRFTSRDPIWDTNLYQYGNSNPWSYTDAEGMQAESPRKLRAEIAALERQGYALALKQIRESGLDPNSPEGQAQIKRYRRAEAVPSQERGPATSDDFNWHNYYFTALNKQHMLPVDAAAYADRMMELQLEGEPPVTSALRRQQEGRREARTAQLPATNVLVFVDDDPIPADPGVIERIARWIDGLHIEERVGRAVLSPFQPTLRPDALTLGSAGRYHESLNKSLGEEPDATAEARLASVGAPVNQVILYSLGTVVITLATSGFGGHEGGPRYPNRAPPLNFTGDESLMHVFEVHVPALKGYQDVIAHGNPLTSPEANMIMHGSLETGAPKTVSEFVDLLRKKGYRGGRLRLFICNSGSTKVGRQLAQKLRTTVIAPTTEIGTRPLLNSTGYLVEGNGRWVKFHWWLPFPLPVK